VEAKLAERDGEQAEDTLVDLMDRYEARIYEFLLAMLRDRDGAQECAQDTFVRAYENLRRGKPVNAQWLYRVARNRANDEFRRGKRVTPDLDLLAALPAPRQGAPEDAAAISQAFSALSLDDRAALYLYAVQGLSADELASALGIKVSALRMRLSRARERFRQAYGGRP
jgi:RNA polymerase sigma-70 factor (ECF subfamily)